MRAIATDGVARSFCLCVCLLVTFMIRTKTAEPIEMPYGGWVAVGVDAHGPKEPCIRLG